MISDGQLGLFSGIWSEILKLNARIDRKFSVNPETSLCHGMWHQAFRSSLFLNKLSGFTY
jgi:hypothetical protein